MTPVSFPSHILVPDPKLVSRLSGLTTENRSAVDRGQKWWKSEKWEWSLWRISKEMRDVRENKNMSIWWISVPNFVAIGQIANEKFQVGPKKSLEIKTDVCELNRLSRAVMKRRSDSTTHRHLVMWFLSHSNKTQTKKPCGAGSTSSY